MGSGKGTLQGAKGAAMLTRLDDKADPAELTTDDLPDGQKASVCARPAEDKTAIRSHDKEASRTLRRRRSKGLPLRENSYYAKPQRCILA